jgi:predicted secreted acid phosphatase
MNGIRKIKRFDSILIQFNSLVLCDIDDTVLNYKNETEEYWKTHNHGDDPKYRKWANLINNVEPKFTCDTFKEFYDVIKNTQSELVFITARDSIHKSMTENQLEKLGITGHEIYFLEGNLKGDFIKNKFEIGRHTIFIDDNEKQVYDVYEKNSHISIYHFEKEYEE